MSIIQKNLKFLRKRSELTQQGFADKISVKRPVVGAYEEGRAEPKIATLKVISDVFKVPLELLITKDLASFSEEQLKNYGIDVSGNRLRVLSISVDKNDNENIELVPVKASAGYTNGYGDPEFIQELPKIYIPMLTGGTYRGFEIKGDSMLPIQPESIVVGQYLDNWHDIKSGFTYVVVTENEGVVYKRVENKIYDEGVLELHSDNKAYSSYSVPVEEVNEIWEAKMYMSSSFPTPQKNNTEEVSFNDMTKMIMELQKEVLALKKDK